MFPLRVGTVGKNFESLVVSSAMRVGVIVGGFLARALRREWRNAWLNKLSNGFLCLFPCASQSRCCMISPIPKKLQWLLFFDGYLSTSEVNKGVALWTRTGQGRLKGLLPGVVGNWYHRNFFFWREKDLGWNGVFKLLCFVCETLPYNVLKCL